MIWFAVFVSASLIGIGSNLDNSGVGIAYGSDGVRFPHWVNAIVNLVGLFTALIGAYAGETVSQVLTARQAAWAACIILIAIGLFFWYVSYIHPRIFPHTISAESPRLGWKHGIGLGFALSVTNIASGFGATVADAATLWITVASIAIWGYIMIWIGNIVGIGLLARLLKRYSSFVAGLMLIAVGLHQVI